MNWSNALKFKYACLDEQDPEAQRMPNPAGTNWRVISGSQYVGKTSQNHPLKLTDDQATSQADLPTAFSFQGPSFEACPSRMVFQRTVIRSVNRLNRSWKRPYSTNK